MNRKQISGLGRFLSLALAAALTIMIDKDFPFFLFLVLYLVFRLTWYQFIDREADRVDK